jgi:threonine aldolase
MPITASITESVIDLRSDTVTQPTAAMRDAMKHTPVGDDVYGEDPAINELQAVVAEMAGFEAALLLPTGTMSNQAAIAAHTERGQEVIMPYGAHVYEYEPGALAVISGVLPRLIPAPLGVPEVEDMRAAIHRNPNQTPTGLIVLENTHNKAGGTVVSLERCHDIAEMAHEEGLPIHLDGARAWNAITALNVSLKDLCEPFDSVSLCLSKGLAAPVGTVLVGSKDLIAKVHRYRKLLGGGMRQAGVIAAAGLVAVREMLGRLGEDHARATRLAHKLVEISGVNVNLDSVQTNMVYFNVDRELMSAPDLAKAMAEQGVKCNALGPATIRLVVHYQIDDADIDKAVSVIANCLRRDAVNA